MNIDLKWHSGICFVASDDRGHELTIDGATEIGGQDSGPRPMELVVVALASCMAIDVVLMLKKARVDLQSFRVRASAERVDAIPKVFDNIHLHVLLRGQGLSTAVADRTLKLAVDKYCSVATMLRPGVKITYSHDVTD